MKKRNLIIILVTSLIVLCVTMISVYAETYLWPAPGVSYISTYYSAAHPGIDIAANGDHEVVAAREGTVKAAASTSCQHINNLGDSCNWGMGNYVQIQHSDGTYATYMHMRYGSITVSVGQYVARGTKIGMMGSSGNSSGQHLHFQVGTSATNTINVSPSVLSYDYTNIPDNRCCFQVTATDGINIRNGAGTSNTVVGAIPYNAYFYITERKQANGYTWGKVDSYNGIFGWCVLDYAKHVGGTLPDLKKDAAQPIHTDNNPHVRNGYFTFKNAHSGTFMNVWGGANQNGTAITTYTFDDSIDQRFNVVHIGNGKYRLYAECSNQGTNKVVDILRNESALSDGQVVDLYDANDETAQLFYIVPLNDGTYVFEIAAKEGYVIAPANATVAGSNTKDSQLKLQKYTGANYQKWKLCNNNGKETTPNISYNAGTYKIDTDGYSLNMRSDSDPNSTLIASIPDKTALKITSVRNNWGYTTYNGINGWVCLDFTVYSVELDSIRVLSNPEKTHYLVGDHLETIGLQIVAQYSNGQTEVLSDGFTVNGDLTSAGTKNISVSYKGKSTYFSVEVKDIEIRSIDIQNIKLTRQYHVRDNINIDEISLVAEYNNGTFEEIKSGFSVDYDFSTPGTKTVTVSYGGKTTSYEVEVVAATEPSETASLAVDSQNSYSGSAVTVPITLNASGVYDGNMTIQYDTDKLVIEDVQAVGALSDRQVFINKDYGADKIRVSFSGTTSIDTDEVILNLKFRVANNAQGTAVVSITEARAYNKSGESIVVNKADGAVQIIPTADDVTVTNIQSVSRDGKKVVTANVSDDSVMCYLAAFKNGALVACDAAQPSNGSVELSVSEGSNTQYKFMTWNMTMKPMMNAIGIY